MEHVHKASRPFWTAGSKLNAALISLITAPWLFGLLIQPAVGWAVRRVFTNGEHEDWIGTVSTAVEGLALAAVAAIILRVVRGVVLHRYPARFFYAANRDVQPIVGYFDLNAVLSEGQFQAVGTSYNWNTSRHSLATDTDVHWQSQLIAGTKTTDGLKCFIAYSVTEHNRPGERYDEGFYRLLQNARRPIEYSGVWSSVSKTEVHGAGVGGHLKAVRQQPVSLQQRARRLFAMKLDPFDVNALQAWASNEPFLAELCKHTDHARQAGVSR